MHDPEVALPDHRDAVEDGREEHALSQDAGSQKLEDALTGYETSKMAALDWSQCAAVERVPGKVSGAWVLRGTRMPVATIFENLEAGANLDDILEWYDGLEREQVKNVIDFAVRSLDPAAPGR